MNTKQTHPQHEIPYLHCMFPTISCQQIHSHFQLCAHLSANSDITILSRILHAVCSHFVFVIVETDACFPRLALTPCNIGHTHPTFAYQSESFH